jgi:hypothetical protein
MGIAGVEGLEIGQAHREILFESESGSLDWNCVAPRSKVAIQVGPEPGLEGWGYAEHLLLTGRFVNATDAVVWIDWSGPYSKRVVYWNGFGVNAEEIGDDTLTLAGKAVLTLDRSVVLRDGVLGATALSVIPNLERLFPDSILNMRECKWLSNAVLRRPGQPDAVGMAIHEVVEWP